MKRCDCGREAVYNTGSGPECADCRRLNRLAGEMLDRVLVEQRACDRYDSERAAYFREYARQKAMVARGAKKAITVTAEDIGRLLAPTMPIHLGNAGIVVQGFGATYEL